MPPGGRPGKAAGLGRAKGWALLQILGPDLFSWCLNSAPDDPRETPSQPAALASHSEAGASCGADTPQDRALTSAEFCQPPPPEEEEEGPGQEPHPEQLHVEPDQSENILNFLGELASTGKGHLDWLG